MTVFFLILALLPSAARCGGPATPPRSVEDIPEPTDEIPNLETGPAAPSAASPPVRPAPAKPAPPRAPTLDELLAAARAKAANRSFAAAAADYARVLKLKPADADLLLEEAKVLWELRRLDEEKTALVAAAGAMGKDDPRRVEATGMLAVIALKKGQTAKAQNLYWRAIEFAKKRGIKSGVVIDAYAGLAYCMERQGRSDDAASVYRVALALMKPDDPRRASVEKQLKALEAAKPAPAVTLSSGAARSPDETKRPAESGGAAKP